VNTSVQLDFHALGVSEPLVQDLAKAGLSIPTPIQAQAIPPALTGRDVIGCAQTGTGKTAAFVIPIMERLARLPKGEPQALILVPTRELALQILTTIDTLGCRLGISATVIVGGADMQAQVRGLRQRPDILVATPGRLLDHMWNGTVNLLPIKILVFDEADRMLDMGFLPDVRSIVEKCPRQRHTSLFSATVPPQIDSLIKWAMKTPQTIEIGTRRSPAETIKHVIYPVAESQKTDLLLELLKRVNYDSVIVFCRTKHRADRIANLLKKNSHAVAVLHSNRTQREREQALRGFRDGRYEVLVATDIAARGLDILNVSHVINFDVPHHPEDYVHRIGRTGRAEASGDAFTLMVVEDAKHVQAIERFIGKKVERTKLEDFNYQYTMLFDEAKHGDLAARQRSIRGVRISGGYYFGPAKRRRH